MADEDVPDPWRRAAENAERATAAQDTFWEAFRSASGIWCVGGPLHHTRRASGALTVTHEVAEPVNGETGVQTSMVHTYKMVQLVGLAGEQAYMWVGAVKVTRGATPRRSIRITQITGLST